MPSAGADAPEAEEPAAPAPRFVLFPPVEEQIERITEAQAEEARAAAEAAQIRMDGADRIPDAVIGRALTAGGNERSSIKRIVAHFQKGFPVADSAEFLKEEFGTGGKGVTIAGQKYALWYNSDGIRIAAGSRALTPNSTLISWTNAALLISDLLHKGMYATQDKIDGARSNEYEELAETLSYLRRDFDEEAQNRGYLSSVEKEITTNVYPEITLQIAELLRKPESRAAITAELRQFADDYTDNPDLLRFHRLHDPEKLWAQLDALNLPVTEFHSADGFEPVRGSFITEDEIDRLLTRGSGVSEGKIRIYSCFMRGYNAKERVDFLKQEYGIGGFGYLGYNEDHDSKGIKFERGDEFSDFKDYDTVFLNWNQVQKRIRQLIDDGKYLNAEEQNYLHKYEMKQLARNVYAFQYYTNPEPMKDRTWDADAGAEQILPILADPVKAKELYDQMFNTWMPLRSDFPHYDALRVPLRDMGMYVRGEYSLFQPLPEEVLEAERRIRQEQKEAKRATRQAMGEDDEELSEDALTDSDGQTVDLRKAARALVKKQKASAKEEPSGQYSLFGEVIAGEQASMFDAAPEPPSPPAPQTQRKTVVVETILSPDLERERRSAEAARKQAEESLAREGITVPDKIMEYITFTLGRNANNVTRIEEMAREILNPTPDPEAAAKYKLGYGHMGNGLTVWNSLEEEHGDYKTVAHIDPDRSVKFYDAKMPESVMMQIIHIAATSRATFVIATKRTRPPPTPIRPPPTQRRRYKRL